MQREFWHFDWWWFQSEQRCLVLGFCSCFWHFLCEIGSFKTAFIWLTGNDILETSDRRLNRVQFSWYIHTLADLGGLTKFFIRKRDLLRANRTSSRLRSMDNSALVWETTNLLIFLLWTCNTVFRFTYAEVFIWSMEHGHLLRWRWWPMQITNILRRSFYAPWPPGNFDGCCKVCLVCWMLFIALAIIIDSYVIYPASYCFWRLRTTTIIAFLTRRDTFGLVKDKSAVAMLCVWFKLPIARLSILSRVQTFVNGPWIQDMFRTLMIIHFKNSLILICRLLVLPRFWRIEHRRIMKERRLDRRWCRLSMKRILLVFWSLNGCIWKFTVTAVKLL